MLWSIDQELEADPENDDERAVHERRIAPNQRRQRPITIRIVMIPRMPPLSTTHSFGDIATATRIESIAKTKSVSSTRTTVPQKAESPIHGLAGGVARRDSASRSGRNAETAAIRDRRHPGA